MTFYFEKLIVWQKSLALSKIIHVLIKSFPKEEQYAPTDQMRRATLSIMSNIAEGSGRSSNADRNHFLTMAKGSCMELASQLILAKEFGYIQENESYQQCSTLIEDIASIIYALTRKE